MDTSTYSEISEFIGAGINTVRTDFAKKNPKSEMQLRVIAAAFACATFSISEAKSVLDFPSINPTGQPHKLDMNYSAHNYDPVSAIGFDYDAYASSNPDVISALYKLIQKLRLDGNVTAIELEQYDSPEDEDSTLLVSIRCSNEDWDYYDRLENKVISPWLESQSLSILSRVTVAIGIPTDHGAV